MTRTFSFKINWLLLFLILLPTFYIYGKDLRDSQNNFFQVSAIVMLALMHVNRYLGALLLWAAFQFVFFKKMPVQSMAIQNLFFGLLIYQFIVMFAKRRDFKKYFLAIGGVLIFNILWCFLQMNDMDPIFRMRDFDNQQIMSEWSGFFGLPAFLGNYSAVALPLLFGISYWLVPFAILGIFFSKSTFSMVAAVLAVLFYFWFKKRIVFWGSLAVLIPTLLFYVVKYDMPTGQFGRRLNVWQLILKTGFREQFFGFGLGNFRRFTFLEVTPTHSYAVANNYEDIRKFLAGQAIIMKDEALVKKIVSFDFNTPIVGLKKEMLKHGMDLERWEQAHNEYLQLLFETGLVGLFLIGLYIADLFKRFFKYVRDRQTLCLAASFIAILIVSAGHFPFHMARLAGPFLVIGALFEYSILMQQRKTNAFSEI